uniref:Secreted protein n=1 Tax=Spongospora subterranea TaxID=70186 RepID=A0A0H5QUG3_9EUKA|eukprot:CRZ05377.1 hypothetical protein [Spongospora subterranea]
MQSPTATFQLSLLLFRFGESFLSLSEHVTVHVRTAWDIDTEGNKSCIVVIEREVPFVWHPKRIHIRSLDVRKSAIYQTNFTCDATRIQQQEGAIPARRKSISELHL